MKLIVPYAMGARVVVDGDSSIVAVVTAYCWRGFSVQAEVQWFNGGALNTAWIDVTRLKLSEG